MITTRPTAAMTNTIRKFGVFGLALAMTFSFNTFATAAGGSGGKGGGPKASSSSGKKGSSARSSRNGSRRHRATTRRAGSSRNTASRSSRASRAKASSSQAKQRITNRRAKSKLSGRQKMGDSRSLRSVNRQWQRNYNRSSRNGSRIPTVRFRTNTRSGGIITSPGAKLGSYKSRRR